MVNVEGTRNSGVNVLTRVRDQMIRIRESLRNVRIRRPSNLVFHRYRSAISRYGWSRNSALATVLLPVCLVRSSIRSLLNSPMHLMRAYRHCERTIVNNRVRRNVFYEEDLVILLMTLVTNKTEVTNGTTTTTTTTSKYDRDDEATVVRSRDVFPEACCGSYVNLATECLLDKFDYRVAGSTDIALRVCNLEGLRSRALQRRTSPR